MKRKILIVDDEESILSGFQEILENADYKVYLSASGTKACQIIEKHRPDLVILDYYLLNDISGVEVCAFIKQKDELIHIKLIMITGVLTKKQAHEMMHFGFDKILIKPVEKEHLLEEIRLLLED